MALFETNIFPGLEPAVIDNELIIQCILEHGPTGEAGKLFAQEGIHIEEAKILYMEFKNLLKINHLWMLKSLTKLSLANNLIEKIENLECLVNLIELNLSFNNIVKIENMNMLVNLEVLSLCHNKIENLGNMENLQKLIIFSISDNLITDFKEFKYLRQFRFLRAVSVEGNPCCQDPMAYYFLKAGLPRVTYLDYKFVSAEDKEIGASHFRSLLHQLEEEDEVREKVRQTKEENDAKIETHRKSFVEYLSGPGLIDAMIEEDEVGGLLMKVEAAEHEFFNEYKEQYVQIMDEFVEWALQAYKDRETDITMFREVMETALDESVSKSKMIIQEFEDKRNILKTKFDLFHQMVSEKSSSEDTDNIKIMEVDSSFDTLLQHLWRNLMDIEMTLFERCEETRVQFSVSMKEKIDKLLDNTRKSFGSWRECDIVFQMKLEEYLNSLMAERHLFKDESSEIREMMNDRDKLMEYVALSANHHSKFIDKREDLLVARATAWLRDLTSTVDRKDIERNRQRISEINHFVDHQKESWLDMQLNHSDTNDNRDIEDQLTTEGVNIKIDINSPALTEIENK